MPEFRDALSDLGLTCFYDFWAKLRGSREMPARTDVDPLLIPRGYLANIMLIDVHHSPRRYRYRLIGTSVVNATGENRTGQYFDEVGFFRAHPTVLEHYETVVATRQPLYSMEPFTNLVSGTTYEVDRLLLPLSADGQLVDTVLVLFQFNSGPFAARLPIDPAKVHPIPPTLAC